MSVFVESVDVDAAWEVYYQLADRRHKDGLTLEELQQVIEAALVGVVEATEETEDDCQVCIDGIGPHPHEWQSTNLAHRFVSPWVEVEEHQ